MQCPYCGSTETTFLRRTRWARFIPGFEYYDCSNCGGTHSRLFIRPLHSFFIAIATFLITLGIYWLKTQNTPPYHREIEQYIAATSQPQPAKVSGPVDDLSAFEKDASPQIMMKPSPADTPEHDGASTSPEMLTASKLEGKSTPAYSEVKENMHKEKPKIKVLIGNKRRSSAEKLAVQLHSIGYTVDRVDVAPRSNFEQLTIYYKEGFKTLALQLGRELGDDFIDKRLSWESQFDLILVTGGNG